MPISEKYHGMLFAKNNSENTIFDDIIKILMQSHNFFEMNKAI